MASSPEIGRQNPHQQAKWLAMILKPSLNKTMLKRLYHNRFFEYQWSMYMGVIGDPQSWYMSLWWMCAYSALAVVNGHHPARLNCVMNDGGLCTGISAAALAKTTSSWNTCTMFTCSKAKILYSYHIFSQFMCYLLTLASWMQRI